MNFNPSYKVRATLYVIITIGGPVVAYLIAKNVIGETEFQLWTGVTTAVGAMAALNATPSTKERADKAAEDLKG